MAASIVGEVLGSGIRPTRRPRFKIFEMLVRDETGSLRAVWFNQPFLNDVFHPHQRVILFGKLELTSHGLQLQSPQYEIVKGDEDAAEACRGAPHGDADDETLHTGRIVPVYEKTGHADRRRCSARSCTRRWRSCRPTLPDPLPPDVRAARN